MAGNEMSNWERFVAEMTENALEFDQEEMVLTEEQKREIVDLAKEKLEAAAYIAEAINRTIESAIKEYIEDMQ